MTLRGRLWTDGVLLTFTADGADEPCVTELLGAACWRWYDMRSLTLRFAGSGFRSFGFLSADDFSWWSSLTYPLGLTRPVRRWGRLRDWSRNGHLRMMLTYDPVRPPPDIVAAADVDVLTAPTGLAAGPHTLSYWHGVIRLVPVRSDADGAELPVSAFRRASVRGRTLTLHGQDGDLVMQVAGATRVTRSGRLTGSTPEPTDPFLEWLRILNDARVLWLPRRTRLQIRVRSPEVDVYLLRRDQGAGDA